MLHVALMSCLKPVFVLIKLPVTDINELKRNPSIRESKSESLLQLPRSLPLITLCPVVKAVWKQRYNTTVGVQSLTNSSSPDVYLDMNGNCASVYQVASHGLRHYLILVKCHVCLYRFYAVSGLLTDPLSSVQSDRLLM